MEAFMSVDDEFDNVTWHRSWQKIDIVSKGDKAGRGRRLTSKQVLRAWVETQEKSSGERWR